MTSYDHQQFRPDNKQQNKNQNKTKQWRWSQQQQRNKKQKWCHQHEHQHQRQCQRQCQCQQHQHLPKWYNGIKNRRNTTTQKTRQPAETEEAKRCTVNVIKPSNDSHTIYSKHRTHLNSSAMLCNNQLPQSDPPPPSTVTLPAETIPNLTCCLSRSLVSNLHTARERWAGKEQNPRVNSTTDQNHPYSILQQQPQTKFHHHDINTTTMRNAKISSSITTQKNCYFDLAFAHRCALMMAECLHGAWPGVFDDVVVVILAFELSRKWVDGFLSSNKAPSTPAVALQ